MWRFRLFRACVLVVFDARLSRRETGLWSKAPKWAAHQHSEPEFLLRGCFSVSSRRPNYINQVCIMKANFACETKSRVFSLRHKSLASASRRSQSQSRLGRNMRFHEPNLIKIDVIIVSERREICWSFLWKMSQPLHSSYLPVTYYHISFIKPNTTEEHNGVTQICDALERKRDRGDEGKGTIALLELDLRASCIIFFPPGSVMKV